MTPHINYAFCVINYASALLSPEYCIYTLVMKTYCVNKRGFQFLSLLYPFLPLSLFFPPLIHLPLSPVSPGFLFCGFVFFATYTCVLSCFVGFLFPSIWPFSYKRAYICAQKSPYICVTNKHVVYAVAESRRITGTELYRQQKTSSCTMELKSNFSLNQAWPQWPR